VAGDGAEAGQRGRGTGSDAAEAAALRAEIAHHDERYHQLDDPEISDAEYDALVRRLRSLEAEHPELAVADSPTQRVGGPISPLFSPVTHTVPMMSLENAFAEEELAAWGGGSPGGWRRRRRSCASSRSTASPCRSATRRAGSCRPPPGATGGWART
jgi:hypothetical protein